MANLIRSEVGNYLLTEGHDGRFSRVVVTDCRVTPDLRIAHVYYTILDTAGRDGAKDEAERVLEQTRKSIRSAVGRALRTKYTPEIHFHFDETLESARRIEDILKTVAPIPDGETEG